MKSARLRSSGAPQIAPEARALLDALPFPAALSTAGGALLHENAAMRASREPGPRDTLSVKLPGAGECTLVIRRPSDAQTQRLAALGFMLAGVCHEISNPLAAIHSMLQILQSKRGVSRETLEKGLASIASNIDRVLAISRKLGDFSRVGAELPSAVALDAAMEAAAALLRHSEQARQVQLDYRGAGGATILARRGQLEQVLFNILLNAAQAMQGKGRIEARAEIGAEGRVLVSIRDSGPGIPAEHLGRLFDPFFTTKAPGAGSGLGLAISYEIVHGLGGTIRASNHPEGGACFELALPLWRA